MLFFWVALTQRLDLEIMSTKKGHGKRKHKYGETRERAHEWGDTGKDSGKGTMMDRHEKGLGKVRTDGESREWTHK